MQRLFTSFAHGAPGAGLLLVRVAVGASLLLHAATALTSGKGPTPAAFIVLALGIALLILVGLWTPFSGAAAALAAGWHGWAHPPDQGFDVLLAVLGIAIALLGPGAWSVDARLFGWKRLELQNGSALEGSADSEPGASG